LAAPRNFFSDYYTTDLDGRSRLFYCSTHYKSPEAFPDRQRFSKKRNDREGEIMQVQPYLSFDGRCEEAVEFYRRVLNAEVISLMRNKQNPDSKMCPPPGSENKIMHMRFRVGNLEIWASDGCPGKPTFHGFSLSLNVANDAEAERLFAALSEDGHVQMPLTKTFFSSRFGMVADRFGVPWMIVVAA
jgi:PhnB protein